MIFNHVSPLPHLKLRKDTISSGRLLFCLWYSLMSSFDFANAIYLLRKASSDKCYSALFTWQFSAFKYFYSVLAEKSMLPGTAVFWARNDTVIHYHFHQKHIWYNTIEYNFMWLIYWCICNTSSTTICSGFKSQFMGFHAFHNRFGTVKRVPVDF